MVLPTSVRGAALPVSTMTTDGDLDLLLSNNGQAVRLYRNDGGSNNWLSIQLEMDGLNRQALGARVLLTANGYTQMREVHCGSNFVSQNPAEAHFGVAGATHVDLSIEWPDGTSDDIVNVGVNRRLRINQQQLRNCGSVPALQPVFLAALWLVLLALGLGGAKAFNDRLLDR